MPRSSLPEFLFFLTGATVAVFISGRQDTAALVAMATAAGCGLLAGRPSCHPGRVPVILSLLLSAAVLSALLPAPPGVLPDWRAGAPDGVVLAGSFAAMPAHAWFWWWVLCGTMAGGLFLLAAPLDGPSLRIFLHAVAGTVAFYTIVSIVQAQTPWNFPFSGGADFGLLPNRNHTASLLVAGSIVSFGLMHWEVARGHRVGAVLSALSGAPALAALLFFSSSRAGVLFLLLGLALWGAGAAVKRRTALTAAVILAVFLAVLLVAGGSTVRDRLGALGRDVAALEAGVDGAPEIDFRQPVFRDTLAMIADAPWTGQGLGHFVYVFPHYREASLRAARVLHPESDWLMVAAESGLPAVVMLLGLTGWFFVRCWRARRHDDGLLRWSAASAIGATLAHGVIDVPWHRPALGWFLLVLALAAVPSTGRVIRRPVFWWLVQAAAALVFLGAAGRWGWDAAHDRAPLPYRWPVYDAELQELAVAGRHDDGEFVARQAIGDFPLGYQAYYWRAGFLRTFEGTEDEISRDLAAGRFAEPVLPLATAEQTLVWAGLDAEREAESVMETVARAARIEKRSGLPGASAAELEKALRAARERPRTQEAIRERLAAEPRLLARWLLHADADLAERYLSDGGSGAELLGQIPAADQWPVLQRWITLPSAVQAAAFMEARGGAAVYAGPLADYYAAAGDKEHAVRVVGEAEGVTRGDGLAGAGEWGQRVGELQARGNEVAVRRLMLEAVSDRESDRGRLTAVMTWAAGRGDWDMAWRAASRLVRMPEKRQQNRQR